MATWPFKHGWAYAWTKVGEVPSAMPQGKGIQAHSLQNLHNASHPDLTADHDARCRNSSRHCRSHCSSWPRHNAHSNRRQVHLRLASIPSMWGLDNDPSDQTHVWQATMSTDDPNNSGLHDSDPWEANRATSFDDLPAAPAHTPQAYDIPAEHSTDDPTRCAESCLNGHQGCCAIVG
mgnify:CR=1 FL=1